MVEGMKGTARKQAETRTAPPVVLEMLRGGGVKAELDFSLRPEERGIVDDLARKCGLRPGRREYFRLRGTLAIIVASTRTLCELSIAETVSGEFDAAAEAAYVAGFWAKYIDAEAKEDYNLDEDTRHTISSVVFRYVDEIISADYNRKMAKATEAISLLATTLNIPLERRDDLRRMILNFAGAATEVATPRLKWDTDRLPNENPAVFAWRAYQDEAKAGTLHRGLIYSEDRELHRRLNSWLRSHDMPEGIDIPTLPEWNSRQIEAAKAAGKPLREVASEEARLRKAERYRAEKAAHLG
jgi:hypothetical protein